MNDCVFCDIQQEDILFQTDHLISFYDRYPVNNGHVLIIPKRHIDSVFQFTAQEWKELPSMLQIIEGYLFATNGAIAFNVGFNDGRAAGQTIWHAHVHVIPRYEGDVPDPRGGIRNIKEPIVKY